MVSRCRTAFISVVATTSTHQACNGDHPSLPSCCVAVSAHPLLTELCDSVVPVDENAEIRTLVINTKQKILVVLLSSSVARRARS